MEKFDEFLKKFDIEANFDLYEKLLLKMINNLR